MKNSEHGCLLPRILRLAAALFVVASLSGSGSRVLAEEDATTPAALCCPAVRPVLKVTQVGRFDFVAGAHRDPNQVSEELSGITYVGVDEYLAVSDRHAFLHRLAIRIDPESGAVEAATIASPLRLKDAECQPFREPDYGPDREGIAYDARSGSVVISNERTGTDEDQPSIARHSMLTGCLVNEMRASSHPDLRIYDQIRRNLGFESLAREPGSGFFWTANEEALHVDGRRATGTHGTVVRLQRLDDALRPVAQYGYVTDPLPGPRPQGRRLRWASGVVELIALPGGRLLALERALVEMEPAVGPVRIRLYEIDLNRAERLGDEALTTGLDDRSYTPVPKSLLISLEFAIESNSNFEGMTLGPHLANGDHSLLLIADNGGGTDQSLYALRISGLPARPCHQSCHSTH